MLWAEVYTRELKRVCSHDMLAFLCKATIKIFYLYDMGWLVRMKIYSDVKGDEIEVMVNKLIDGEKGKI